MFHNEECLLCDNKTMEAVTVWLFKIITANWENLTIITNYTSNSHTWMTTGTSILGVWAVTSVIVIGAVHQSGFWSSAGNIVEENGKLRLAKVGIIVCQNLCWNREWYDYTRSTQKYYYELLKKVKCGSKRHNHLYTEFKICTPSMPISATTCVVKHRWQ